MKYSHIQSHGFSTYPLYQNTLFKTTTNVYDYLTVMDIYVQILTLTDTGFNA